jgi:hypothetical protein
MSSYETRSKVFSATYASRLRDSCVQALDESESAQNVCTDIQNAWVPVLKADLTYFPYSLDHKTDVHRYMHEKMLSLKKKCPGLVADALKRLPTVAAPEEKRDEKCNACASLAGSHSCPPAAFPYSAENVTTTDADGSFYCKAGTSDYRFAGAQVSADAKIPYCTYSSSANNQRFFVVARPAAEKEYKVCGFGAAPTANRGANTGQWYEINCTSEKASDCGFTYVPTGDLCPSHQCASCHDGPGPQGACELLCGGTKAA